MLAIAPELVREDVARAEYSAPYSCLVQADLNVFGVAHFHASGVVGFPQYATREKGAGLIKAVRKNLTAHACDRLQRLRENPPYAAPSTSQATLEIRALIEADIPAAMNLKTLARWNQTENDWRFLIAQNPDGRWVATRDEQIAGTTTLMTYGDCCGWIGMVLVDPNQRRIGVATTLLQHAIGRAPAGMTLKLDATAAGETVYNKLGFETEYSLDRWIRRAPSPKSNPKNQKSANQESISSLLENDWPEIAALDGEVCVANRLALLQYEYSQSAGQAFVARDENSRNRRPSLERPFASTLVSTLR